MKWFYIVSQTFFMNLTMENPPWITVHLRLLLRNKLCTWHENKLPETFSVGQLSREIWNRCIVFDLCVPACFYIIKSSIPLLAESCDPFSSLYGLSFAALTLSFSLSLSICLSHLCILLICNGWCLLDFNVLFPIHLLQLVFTVYSPLKCACASVKCPVIFHFILYSFL